jgi:hypothetical protein
MGIGLALSIGLFGSGLEVQTIALRAALTGFAVGIAQWLVLRNAGVTFPLWIPIITLGWVIGWLITQAARVDLSLRWAIFGSTGAIGFALLTAFALALLLYKSR